MSSSEIESESFFIQPSEVNERIDKILYQKFSGKYSRTYFQYLLSEGLVLVNSEPVKKRAKLKLDDEVSVQFLALPEISLEPQNIPLDILYEDEYLIVINKPAKMVVHPAQGNWSNTLVNALLYHCKYLPSQEADVRPGIVHRLDKDTSGIIIAAKTLEVQKALSLQFFNRTVTKVYLAICMHKPAVEQIEAPIARDPYDRKKMAVVNTGKYALTKIQVVRYAHPYSLLKLNLVTGRTHQIRVHLNHIGCPIVGDTVYGIQSLNNKVSLSEQLLHAYSLTFNHPISQQKIHLKALPPLDFQQFYSSNFSEKLSDTPIDS